MKTKEEVVKEAWGVHYSSDIDENGYRNYTEYQSIHMEQWVGNFWQKGINKVTKRYWVRPKSLQGIEDNNGWIKIESDEDLPKESGDYYTIYEGDSSFFINEFSYGSWKYNNFKIQHYQPVVKPKKLPIY